MRPRGQVTRVIHVSPHWHTGTGTPSDPSWNKLVPLRASKTVLWTSVSRNRRSAPTPRCCWCPLVFLHAQWLRISPCSAAFANHKPMTSSAELCLASFVKPAFFRRACLAHIHGSVNAGERFAASPSRLSMDGRPPDESRGSMLHEQPGCSKSRGTWNQRATPALWLIWPNDRIRAIPANCVHCRWNRSFLFSHPLFRTDFRALVNHRGNVA